MLYQISQDNSKNHLQKIEIGYIKDIYLTKSVTRYETYSTAIYKFLQDFTAFLQNDQQGWYVDNFVEMGDFMLKSTIKRTMKQNLQVEKCNFSPI